MNLNSKLYFHFGTMEAGKSALLLMEAHSFETRGIGIICIKPSIDDREGEDVIKSRMGIERKCLSIYPNYNIYEIIKKCIENSKEADNPLQWILADECQFFTTRQIDQLRMVVDELNINVKCYGLRTDFKTHLFEGSKRLFEVADDIEEMKISCDCGKKAIFNVRYNENGQLVTNGEQILIGGKDIYRPMCSKCYMKELMKE